MKFKPIHPTSMTPFRPLLILAGCLLTSSLGMTDSGRLLGQEKEVSSRRETEAIKAVESAGGRVYRISVADMSREISFNLASKPIGDDHLKGLNGISNVIWVNLAGTKITDEGLQQLAGMPLKKLHLERTQIGDAGLAHLKSFKELEYLNLYDTKITNTGLEQLKALKGLKKLYVWKTAVTEDGMKSLRDALPDLEIVGELKLKPVVIEDTKTKAAEAKPQTEKKQDKKEEPKKKPTPKKAAEDKKDNKSD